MVCPRIDNLIHHLTQTLTCGAVALSFAHHVIKSNVFLILIDGDIFFRLLTLS